MRVETLRIGMRVRHPQYGEGEVRGLTEHMAEIQFADGKKTLEPFTSGIEPAEPEAFVGGLEMPLDAFIERVVSAAAERLAAEGGEEDPIVEELGKRWRSGTLTLKPADPGLQSKDMPLETFFHKVVMVRNNLRVLEQKINAHAQLSDADKVEMQQYVTRSYGSLTTFNILFADKDGQFGAR